MSDKVLVHYEVQDKVALLTLDDPPANTYTHEMMAQLDAAIVRARFDTDVEVIVLTGKGETFFCAGANINMPNETLSRLEQTPKLTIAALNGHTVGGGLEIAMAADMRIARKDAGKVGLPEINLGVLPGTGGTARLTRMVGKAKAMELMITGEVFGFEKAEELGVVNQVWDTDGNDDFMAKIMEYAKQFTTPNCATMAAGHIKRSVQSGAEIPFEYHLALERELQAKLFASEDAKEGLAAYVEKRKGEFSGA